MTKAFDNHLILSKFTKEELVMELIWRDGVEYTEVMCPDKYWIEQTDDGEHYDSLRGVGTATILVVKR
jgi:hypothetical protein